MKRQDWIDYFEAINGRTPNDFELEQALANGEFTDEPTVQDQAQETAPTQVTSEQSVAQPQAEPVAPTPAPQTVYQQPQGQPQATGQQFTAPQVGFSQAQQGQQNIYNVQVAVPSAYSGFFNQFWTWLVSAWKSPLSVVPTHPKNGYFAFFLLTFFASLTLFILGNQATTGFGSLVNSFANTGYTASLDISVFFSLFFGLGFFFFSIIFAGFVVRQIVYKDKTMTFSGSFEFYGRLFGLNVLFFALSAIFAILRVYSLVALSFLVSYLTLSVSSSFAIANFEHTAKFDKLYQYLIGIIVNSIIIIIFFIIGSMVAGESALNNISNMFNIF